MISRSINVFARDRFGSSDRAASQLSYSKAMTDRELLAQIARSAGGKAGYKQLVRELGLGGGRERRLLLQQLARITARGDLVKTDSEQWAIPSAAPERTARPPRNSADL